MVYLITFVCYGRHLHGVESGSVDREHNVPGSPLLNEDVPRAAAEGKRMDHPPYNLDAIHRAVVLETIQEVCRHHAWDLLAAHVRSSHVHAVVAAELRPERVMNAFKAYASRRLNCMEPNRKRWARHGSTRWLWKPEQISAAIEYVVDGQGEPMAVFLASTEP